MLTFRRPRRDSRVMAGRLVPPDTVHSISRHDLLASPVWGTWGNERMRRFGQATSTNNVVYVAGTAGFFALPAELSAGPCLLRRAHSSPRPADMAMLKLGLLFVARARLDLDCKR